MSFADWLHDRAVREIAEVKRVPATLAVVFLLGVLSAGWFYAERIAVLELRLAAATEGRPVSGGSTPWSSVAAWVVAAAFLVLSAAWFVSDGRKRREIRALVRRVDDMQERLQSASNDHGRLKTERDSAIKERDSAAVALKDTKHEYAMMVLQRYSNMRFSDSKQPVVTVRYCSYADDDHEVVERIKGIFTQYVRWPVSVDATNVPALPRADKHKVVFDTGMTHLTYGDLIHAISDADLLGVPVGVKEWVERDDSHNLIVTVLPSSGTALG